MCHPVRDAISHSCTQEKFQLEFRRKLSGGCLRRTPSTTTAAVLAASARPNGMAHSEMAITPNAAGGRQVGEGEGGGSHTG